jgi:hypothetical protein
MSYTNNSGVPLPLAIWLTTDGYDHNPDPKVISATTLIKPIKQLVMASRVPEEEQVTDVSNIIYARIGTAIHTAIEEAWINNYELAMKILGYPEHIIDRVQINPTDEELRPDSFPVYMEQRVSKEILGYTISGKYDLILEGTVEDYKSTGTYTYIHKSNDKKYALQGSIYRWLEPNKITSDFMNIQYVFTNWTATSPARDPKYPPTQALTYRVDLMSVSQTEKYVTDKLTQLEQLINVPESELPPCNDEDLWRDPPKYKYYKNPAKRARSTKNFDNPADAYLRASQDGGKGIVVEMLGTAKACRYCPAVTICKQAAGYVLDGTLKL